MKRHPKCKRPVDAFELLVLDGKTLRWRRARDTDKIGLAFVGLKLGPNKKSEGAAVWVAHCKCKVHAKCPASKGLDKACDLYDGASLERV